MLGPLVLGAGVRRATRRMREPRNTGSNSLPSRQSPPNRSQFRKEPWALATVRNTESGGNRSGAARTGGSASARG